MDDAYFSDDSSFYGDKSYVKKLEKRSTEVDVLGYWETHERNLNVMFNLAASTDRLHLPKGGLHNRYEGQEPAWQLDETVEEFLARLPVLRSSWIGPWLWVANPYSERDTEPEERDATFMQQAPRLLSDYLEQRHQLTEENPTAAQGTITRRLKPARDKLKEDILSLAKEKGMTSGKWMLFPSADDAPGLWKRIVPAVIENKLGTAAKISTDGDTRLICVYTKDFSDEEDVKRVAQVLQDMGLLPGERGVYYKCDAYTYLDISSQNEYGLQASLYGSKDVLAGKRAEVGAKTAGKAQKTVGDSGAGSKAAGKRRRIL